MKNGMFFGPPPKEDSKESRERWGSLNKCQIALNEYMKFAEEYHVHAHKDAKAAKDKVDWLRMRMWAECSKRYRPPLVSKANEGE